jgi:glutamate-1-semialdehyde 2,1-aminomutase
MAIGTALHVTGRRTVLVFEEGYHGGVLSFAHGIGPLNVPHDFLMVPFNDVHAVEAAFAERGASIACVVVEPVQGSGGCIPAEPGFLEALRSLCTEHGSVLIFDEVMTSRLHPGGAQARFGVLPDMTTLGKYLAGGMTFGAFGGRRRSWPRSTRSRAARCHKPARSTTTWSRWPPVWLHCATCSPRRRSSRSTIGATNCVTG